MDALPDLLGIITSTDESDRDIFAPPPLSHGNPATATIRGQSKRVSITSSSVSADRRSRHHDASERPISPDAHTSGGQQTDDHTERRMQDEET